MDDIQIHPMEEKHIKALAELEALCFGALAWNEQGLGDELTNNTAHFLVMEKSGRVVGYIGTFVVLDSCYVSNIAITPDCRKQGLGAMLLHRACENARSLGALSISLEVRPSNSAALALYEKLGFEEIGLRKNFYREPKEDALILSLDLNGSN